MPKQDISATWCGCTVRAKRYVEKQTWNEPGCDDIEDVYIDGINAELDEFICQHHEEELMAALREQNP